MIPDYKKITGPVEKLVEMNVSQVKKMIEAQQRSTQDYMELAKSRMEAAANIKDTNTLSAFFKEQMELSQANYEKVLTDNQNLIEEVQGYGEEVRRLLNESSETLKDELSKAGKS
jgi:phasin family protein